jgi:hypothetical protein
MDWGIVIPAEAGIQIKNNGFRIKCGMTIRKMVRDRTAANFCTWYLTRTAVI